MAKPGQCQKISLISYQGSGVGFLWCYHGAKSLGQGSHGAKVNILAKADENRLLL